MGKIIRITESHLRNVISRIIREQQEDSVNPTSSTGYEGLTPSAPSNTPSQNLGNPKVENIKNIQRSLKSLDPYLSIGTGGQNNDGVDGIFGGATERAVKLFQQKNGLPVTGVVTFRDVRTMNQQLASKNLPTITLLNGASVGRVRPTQAPSQPEDYYKSYGQPNPVGNEDYNEDTAYLSESKKTKPKEKPPVKKTTPPVPSKKK